MPYSQTVALSCPDCGQKILIPNPVAGKPVACSCGSQLKLMPDVSGHPVMRVLVRYPFACKPIPPEVTPDIIHTELQREINARGIDAVVDNVRIIKGKRFHYVLPDIWTPAGSPEILVGIMLGLYLVAKYILPTLAIIFITWVAYDLLRPRPHYYYCPYCGEAFESTAVLKAHIGGVHPEMPQHVCPYCGLSFATEEEVAAHMKECPERPVGVLEKIPWTAVMVVGAVIGVAVIARAILGGSSKAH